MHSEMHPVWQNPIQRTVRTAYLSVLMIVHKLSYDNTTQNSSDNLPLILPDKHHLEQSDAINKRSESLAATMVNVQRRVI